MKRVTFFAICGNVQQVDESLGSISETDSNVPNKKSTSQIQVMRHDLLRFVSATYRTLSFEWTAQVLIISQIETHAVYESKTAPVK